MRLALLLVLSVALAGCSVNVNFGGGDEPCRPLVLDLLDDEAAVGEAIEMEVRLANCGAEPRAYATGCQPPRPAVEVDGHTYHVTYGAAYEAVPACGPDTDPMEVLEPGEGQSWRFLWNGTVVRCDDANPRCGDPMPAPGPHVLRVEVEDDEVTGSVLFR